MSKKATIEPGARVYAGSDYLGPVERTVPREDTPTAEYPDLIVRGADDDKLYQIPGALVRSRRRSHGHTVVHADLGARPLASFLSAGATTTAKAPTRASQRGDETRQRRDDDTHDDTHDDTNGDAHVRRIPVWSEELVAEKRPVTADTLHIRKRGEDVEQRLNVPLEREELVVEHLRPEEYDGHAANGPDEWIIPVHEERLVVRKQTVIAEYVRVRRHRRTEAREVRDTVRREVVELESDAAGPLADSQARDGTIAPAAPAMDEPAAP